MWNRWICVVAIFFLSSGWVVSQEESDNWGWIDRVSCLEIMENKTSKGIIPQKQVSEVKELLWQKYVKEEKNKVRGSEVSEKLAYFKNATMRYEYKKIGSEPEGGYPLYIALHGGGGAPTQMNNQQWEHMKIYYRDSVDSGIYLAPRGVSDTWNLHFRGESYVLYDRIIENMILWENINSNKVYLLGFSAGGDGVYQVSPRMADRFAAINMSAGHHNNTSPKNLFNLPTLIQVGELDISYKRNIAAVDFYQKLQKLRAQHHSYPHDIFLHWNRPHNFLDNHPRGIIQKVIADPNSWKVSKNRLVRDQNTNAIHWLREYTRNPYPTKIIWDTKTVADRSGRSDSDSDLWKISRKPCFYWLQLEDKNPQNDIQVSVQENTFVVDNPCHGLAIYISEKLVDLSRPVYVKIGEKKYPITVKPHVATVMESIFQRGDFHYTFIGKIVIKQGKQGWNVKQQL